jgi:hypothetical protein
MGWMAFAGYRQHLRPSRIGFRRDHGPVRLNS